MSKLRPLFFQLYFAYFGLFFIDAPLVGHSVFSWILEENKNHQQEAYHSGLGQNVTIDPPLTSYGKWHSCHKNLLLIDISLSKVNRFFSSTPSSESLKKWNLRLYLMDKNQWMVWKNVLYAQDLTLLQVFETDSSTVVDLFLKESGGSNSPKDELLRLWLHHSSASLDMRVIAKGNFTKALASPVLREGGCGRFLFTLDNDGKVESFDTLKGYFKRQFTTLEVKNFDVKRKKNDPSQFFLELLTMDDKIKYLDAYNLQTISESP